VTTADEIRVNRKARTTATPEQKRELDDQLPYLIRQALTEGVLAAQLADITGLPRKTIHQLAKP